MSFIFSQKNIEQYKHLRAVDRGLQTKVRDATQSLDFDILKAAKKLTIPVSGRTLVFEGEEDSTALMDFFFHEFRKGSRRLLDCCDPDAMGLSPDERDLLEAHRQGRTSLFDIVGTDGKNAQVHLRDVLAPGERDVMLTDIALSEMSEIAWQGVLFVRVLACQGIEMSSGCFFAFSREHRERLCDGYSHRMKTVPAGDVSERRFIYFFQQHREFGDAQALAEP